MREITADDVAYTRRVVLSMPVSYKLGVDDAIGAGLLGLWHAALSFNEAYDAAFRTHARRRIAGAVVDEARRADHLTRCHRGHVNRGELGDQLAPASLEGLLAGSDELSLGGTVAAEDEDIALRMTLDDAISAVEGRPGAVLRLWLDDVPQVEIATIFGVSPSRISQVLRQTLNALAEAIGAELRD